MSKTEGQASLIPYAEVVIRPTDSRPITIQLLETVDGSWDAQVSDGTFQDMHDAVNVLNAMVSMAMAMANVRQTAAHLRDKLTGIANGDIPF